MHFGVLLFGTQCSYNGRLISRIRLVPIWIIIMTFNDRNAPPYPIRLFTVLAVCSSEWRSVHRRKS